MAFVAAPGLRQMLTAGERGGFGWKRDGPRSNREGPIETRPTGEMDPGGTNDEQERERPEGIEDYFEEAGMLRFATNDACSASRGVYDYRPR